jgi:hypothetical protein
MAPITQYLDGLCFNPEAIRVMGLAFEMARTSDRTGPANEILAKIIALAQEGLLDPNLMCEWALNDLRKP